MASSDANPFVFNENENIIFQPPPDISTGGEEIPPGHRPQSPFRPEDLDVVSQGENDEDDGGDQGIRIRRVEITDPRTQKKETKKELAKIRDRLLNKSAAEIVREIRRTYVRTPVVANDSSSEDESEHGTGNENRVAPQGEPNIGVAEQGGGGGEEHNEGEEVNPPGGQIPVLVHQNYEPKLLGLEIIERDKNLTAYVNKLNDFLIRASHLKKMSAIIAPVPRSRLYGVSPHSARMEVGNTRALPNEFHDERKDRYVLLLTQSINTWVDNKIQTFSSRFMRSYKSIIERMNGVGSVDDDALFDGMTKILDPLIEYVLNPISRYMLQTISNMKVVDFPISTEELKIFFLEYCEKILKLEERNMLNVSELDEDRTWLLYNVLVLETDYSYYDWLDRFLLEKPDITPLNDRKMRKRIDSIMGRKETTQHLSESTLFSKLVKYMNCAYEMVMYEISKYDYSDIE
jgi:hypothetical protein